jgi:LysM repeat protein
MDPCPAGTAQYTVRQGDTLWRIAQQFKTNVESIRSLNPELSQDMLFIGQTLCLPHHTIAQSGMVISELSLSNHLRMLWTQHVYWTRLFIVSSLFNLPDAEPVTNRLLRNPKDFADALRPIYGDMAAAKFSDLLTAHLTIAAQLVKAAAAGDHAAAAQYERQWYSNADDIARVLSQLNPYWSEQEWRRLLYDHLAMTKQEAVDYITHQYSNSISTFDRIEKEALVMADYMTAGIRNQYPGVFTA